MNDNPSEIRLVFYRKKHHISIVAATIFILISNIIKINIVY